MSATNKTNINIIVTTATKLFDERVQFEEAMIARTNKGLYEMLAKVYALYIKAEKDGCLKESVAEMKNELSKRGIKTQKNTNPITVFIRYVFNSDRKRSYTYTQVLLVAMRDHIAPNFFVDYIESNNGLEETKLSKSVSDEQQKTRDALEQAESIVTERLKSMSPIHTLELNGATVDLSDDVDYVFVIARKNAAGDIELLQAVPNATIGMLNTAIKLLAKQAVDSNSYVDTNDLQEEKARTLKVSIKNDELQNINKPPSAFDDAVNSATLS